MCICCSCLSVFVVVSCVYCCSYLMCICCSCLSVFVVVVLCKHGRVGSFALQMKRADSSHKLIPAYQTTPIHDSRHLNMQAIVVVNNTQHFTISINSKKINLFSILQKQSCTSLSFKKERKTKHIRKSKFKHLNSREALSKTQDNQSSGKAKKDTALHSYFWKGKCQNWMSNLCVLNLKIVT